MSNDNFLIISSVKSCYIEKKKIKKCYMRAKLIGDALYAYSCDDELENVLYIKLYPTAACFYSSTTKVKNSENNYLMVLFVKNIRIFNMELNSSIADFVFRKSSVVDINKYSHEI